jgi:hypothetical protein
MASIGRFALSLASGVQETSFALANLNLDFAMVRLEAPIEFQGLGTSLSKRRRQQAEEGSVHMTARRLGALFADDLPAIPNLTRAYGLRASEIAETRPLIPLVIQQMARLPTTWVPMGLPFGRQQLLAEGHCRFIFLPVFWPACGLLRKLSLYGASWSQHGGQYSESV